jgi:hypothetical protein
MYYHPALRARHNPEQSVAIRMHTKWNTGGSKTIEDRAGVVGFNIWKIAKETWIRMEKEGFRAGQDRQLAAVITEMIAFLVQVSDRLVYGQLSEEERARFINALGKHLAHTMQSNMLDMFGPGDHATPFINTLNARAADYAEFEFAQYSPSYGFLRYLGEKMSEAMAATDNKWVIEHVIEIEAPEALKPIKKLIGEVLGVKVS